MANKFGLILGGILLCVQFVYGQPLPWHTFMFYDIKTDPVSSKHYIKVYKGPFVFNNNNVDSAYTLEINDSKISEYVMAALVNTRSCSKIQFGTDGTPPNQYKVYRFMPLTPYENTILENSNADKTKISNLHSFGFRENESLPGTIFLDVWLVNEYFIYSLINVVHDSATFVLEPTALHSEKLKFDYMVAGLVNYDDRVPISGAPVNAIASHSHIEIIRNGSIPVGLRFHTTKLGLGANP